MKVTQAVYEIRA